MGFFVFFLSEECRYFVGLFWELKRGVDNPWHSINLKAPLSKEAWKLPFSVIHKISSILSRNVTGWSDPVLPAKAMEAKDLSCVCVCVFNLLNKAQWKFVSCEKECSFHEIYQYFQPVLGKLWLTQSDYHYPLRLSSEDNFRREKHLMTTEERLAGLVCSGSCN